jgi:hypothetical protein
MKFTWTKILPTTEGWWWFKDGALGRPVEVRRRRAYGMKLCAFVIDEKRFIPAEEIRNALWAGPIPYPQEP